MESIRAESLVKSFGTILALDGIGLQIAAGELFFLARGRDHAGNPYGDPTQTYMEMARTRTKHIRSGH